MGKIAKSKKTKPPLMPQQVVMVPDTRSPEERLVTQLYSDLAQTLTISEQRLLSEMVQAIRKSERHKTEDQQHERQQHLIRKAQAEHHDELIKKNMEIANLKAMLADQKLFDKKHKPRTRQQLLSHFQRQVADPERYGLDLNPQEIEELQRRALQTPPDWIIQGTSVVRLTVRQHHDIFALLTPCDTGELTLTTAYTEMMFL